MRMPELDGLRGWAALVVVLNHVALMWGGLPKRFHIIFIDGRLAVFVFFALSGFVLSAPFFQNGNRRALIDQALRRYPRLTLPILASSAIVFAYIQSGAMQALSQYSAQYSVPLTWAYAFSPTFEDLLRYSFFDVYANYAAVPTYNAVLWTMQYEMAGSFIVFAILLVAGQSDLKRVAGIGLFVVFGGLYSPPLFAFALGMVLACLNCTEGFGRFKSSRAGETAAMTVLLLTMAAASLRTSDYDIVLPICGAGILAAVLTSSALSRRMRTPAGLWLGSFSFSIYLVHLVALSACGWLFVWLRQDGAMSPAGIGLMIVAAVGASLAAGLLFSPVERAAIVFSRTLSRSVLELRRSVPTPAT